MRTHTAATTPSSMRSTDAEAPVGLLLQGLQGHGRRSRGDRTHCQARRRSPHVVPDRKAQPPGQVPRHCLHIHAYICVCVCTCMYICRYGGDVGGMGWQVWTRTLYLYRRTLGALPVSASFCACMCVSAYYHATKSSMIPVKYMRRLSMRMMRTLREYVHLLLPRMLTYARVC